MVRSYLIENRICYQGDAGVGSDTVDRSNPAEMRAREQALEDQIIRRAAPNVEVGSDEARDIFAGMVSDPSDGLAAGVAEVQRAERAAAERQARRGGFAGSGDDTNLKAYSGKPPSCFV